LGLIGLMEGALLDWSEFAKGFCTRALGSLRCFRRSSVRQNVKLSLVEQMLLL
jgi:hypothetical protein